METPQAGFKLAERSNKKGGKTAIIVLFLEAAVKKEILRKE